MAAVDVEEREKIARLLRVPAMLDESGKIQSNAFSTGKLKEASGESVDRCGLLGENFHDILSEKASTMRDDYSSYCVASAGDIRAIRSQENEQLFEVLPDPLVGQPATPWDHAHAKLVVARPGLSPSALRGHRDELIALFKQAVRNF